MTNHSGALTKPEAVTPRQISPAVVSALTAMMESVPDTSDDAWDNILRSIVNADSPEALDDAWDSEGMRRYVDTQFVVNRLRKRPSDYPNGLGWYVIAECRDSVGNEFTVTTGSASIMAQLLTAFTKGWMPIAIVPRYAGKANPDHGGRAMRLEIVSTTAKAK